jgi:hypothetical protein
LCAAIAFRLALRAKRSNPKIEPQRQLWIASLALAMTAAKLEPYVRDLAAGSARGVQERLRLKSKRAQGMPDAQCTRSLACE